MTTPLDPELAAALPAATAFAAKPHELMIDGGWSPAESGRSFDVIDPATAAVVGAVAEGGPTDVDRAVRAARRAFDSGPWGSMSGAQRAKHLLKIAELIEANAAELAVLETIDNGKPVTQTRTQNVRGAVEKFEYFAGLATKLRGETMETSAGAKALAFTLREPLGVAGLIIPWNVPLGSAASKLAPALAAGCTAVLKPAEQTPLSAIRLGELVLEAGLPDGVVNIVTGFGADAGAAIAAHPGVDKVSFTGSTATGKAIIQAATGNLKRVTLELGGKSPVVVFPDADLDAIPRDIATAIFNNTGQICAAGSRLFAHVDVFDRLVGAIAGIAKGLRVGPGLEPGSDLGPLVSAAQHERVMGYIEQGRRDGAEVVVGGNAIERAGYFVEPTILTNTRADMSVRREEIFGPVLCAIPFDDDDLDAIAAEANDTEYGLAARVYTRDLSRGLTMARKIKAGSVRVNGGGIDVNVPFGGYKQSGWGREGGHEGIENFTELKSVIVKL